jgi:hypothetical protein
MSDSEKEASSLEIYTSDEEDEYISKEELIKELNSLVKIIQTKKVSKSFLQDVHDSIEEYITEKETRYNDLNPQLINFIQEWLSSSTKINICTRCNSIVIPLKNEV